MKNIDLSVNKLQKIFLLLKTGYPMILKSNKLLDWNTSIKRLHSTDEAKNIQSLSFRRLVFDEICVIFYSFRKQKKS